MQNYLSVSVIIPTQNRAKLLKDALLSLNSVIYPREKFEVVVVDDGSTDNTAEVVRGIKGDLNYKFSFIHESKRGISYAKNIAIKNSRGEIIISTDDDCMFEKDWLEKLLLPFEAPGVGVVGGPDKPFLKANLFSKCADYAFTCFVGSGGVHGRFLPMRLGKFIPMGCNMALRRDALEKTGLFNERIAPGEETDLVHRIEKEGFLIGHNPNAFVWHKAIDNLDGFIKMIFRRGFARVGVIRNHGKYSEMIYILPALTVAIAIALIILSFFFKAAVIILIFLTSIYMLLILSSAIVAFAIYKNIGVLFLVPCLLVLQHFLHGFGFWVGVFKSFLLQRKNA